MVTYDILIRLNYCNINGNRLDFTGKTKTPPQDSMYTSCGQMLGRPRTKMQPPEGHS